MRDQTEPFDRSDASQAVAIVVSVWFLAALFTGAGGLLALAPPPFPQVVLAALVLAALAAVRWTDAGRSWAMTVDLRILVLIHVSRLVGLYFLLLHSRGELPYDFAVAGGLGDIVVALVALAIVLFVPRRTAAGFWILAIWNVLGLLDILFVVATAGRLAMADPFSMRRLLWLPLSLLPTFLVPVIIASHVLIVVRLLTARRMVSGAS